VLRVEANSLAQKAGFQMGDEIQSLAGQPPLSIADVQWVLHHVSPGGGSVKALVKRGGKTTAVNLDLPKGWRERDDIAWRASSWELRRMGLGAMFVKPMTVGSERSGKCQPVGWPCGWSTSGSSLRTTLPRKPAC
ncbi:MAG TPA: PDZ domain-containing protein, partial [Pirellulaceae bacterium]|nr:PDZ domain-containing protein [Pirellulaceae bacterium]